MYKRENGVEKGKKMTGGREKGDVEKNMDSEEGKKRGRK